MINGLAVLGWGVGGIEAEAAMLGQPISMLIPEMIGFKLTGKLREGVTATDLVLTVTQMLRKKGVVGKFVEFYGPGLDELSLEDRATIANMAPEYGATCGFFPIDAETVRFLRTPRASRRASRWWRNMPRRRACGAPPSPPIRCSPTRSSWTWHGRALLAGPMRPQDRVVAAGAAGNFAEHLIETWKKEDRQQARQAGRQRTSHRPWRCGDRRHHLLHQHLQPQRDDRRRPGGQKAVERG